MVHAGCAEDLGAEEAGPMRWKSRATPRSADWDTGQTEVGLVQRANRMQTHRETDTPAGCSGGHSMLDVLRAGSSTYGCELESGEASERESHGHLRMRILQRSGNEQKEARSSVQKAGEGAMPVSHMGQLLAETGRGWK